MKTKDNYIKPEIELIELEMEENAMLNVSGSTDGPANAPSRPRKGLSWDEE